jgi:4,5-dihydroxyphthalate decarboxylase
VDAEASFFAETGLFPSYHVLVIEEAIVGHSGWVVASLIKAFEEAKRIALDALDRDSSLLSSPWAAHLLEKQYSLLRRDMYPYGLEANRKELETLLRYLYEQGLVSKVMPLEEIFASEDS